MSDTDLRDLAERERLLAENGRLRAALEWCAGENNLLFQLLLKPGYVANVHSLGQFQGATPLEAIEAAMAAKEET
jgi:hypothetical protein